MAGGQEQRKGFRDLPPEITQEQMKKLTYKKGEFTMDFSYRLDVHDQMDMLIEMLEQALDEVTFDRKLHTLRKRGVDVLRGEEEA